MLTTSLKLIKPSVFFAFLILGIFLIKNGFDTLTENKYRQIKFQKVTPKEMHEPSRNTTKQKIINLKKDQQVFERESIKKIEFKEIFLTVKKNDTFSKLIDPFFNNKIKNIIIKKLSKNFNLKNLKINQKIFLYENFNGNIIKIVIPKNFDTDIIIDIQSNNALINEEKIEISKEINALKFIIFSSLYEDGIKAGIPLQILADAVRLYSFDIDFQRDIQKNTEFEVSYESLHNLKRDEIKYSDIKYINLKISNQNLEYFFFKTDEGYDDYFNREGKNVKKSILKTPINGARLSSNFGMRKHPISGYNKLHKGVDFAAPKGTPIYAGGNGVIEFKGNNGGYGKYIRIRHNNDYKTAYAHLSAFKKDLSKGKRVNQGEIIGYVGSTGNSTGAHLHYEIILNNKQINPMKLKLPSGKILSGKEFERFKFKIKSIYSEYLYELYE